MVRQKKKRKKRTIKGYGSAASATWPTIVVDQLPVTLTSNLPINRWFSSKLLTGGGIEKVGNVSPFII